jgi:flagellar hook-associated protein 3 FlgL
MRISTAQIYLQGIEAFGQQQAKLAKLQQQISTGTRLTKPSDDPAASSRVLELDQTISLQKKYQVNISIADNRLSLEETTLTTVENITFRLRELSIQANSSALDITGRQAIGVEVEQRLQELISLGNTKDANGDYLFAGFQNGAAPFIPTTIGTIQHVVYNGDQGQRLLQISESRQISVDNPGSEVFLQIPSTTALNELAAPANTGTGVMSPAHVFDASTYVASNVQITFTTPTTYDVVDSATPANNVVGATFTSNSNIDVGGVRLAISGAPAAGDVFSVSQGQFKDIFESVQTLGETLKSSVSSAQLSANFASFQTDLDGFFTRILEVRTSIGGRLNALDGQKEANEANIMTTQTTLSTLRDTDLAAAISQLTLEQTTLDAAQAVFSRITSSSLFNFLR